MQPRLILTLGAYVPSIMAPLSPELKHIWSGVKRLAILDEKKVMLVYPSTFVGVLQCHLTNTTRREIASRAQSLTQAQRVAMRNAALS